MKNTVKGIIFVLTFVILSKGVHAQIMDTIEQPATGIDSAFCTFDKDGKAHLRAELNPKEIKALEDGAKRLVEEFNNNVAKLWRPWTEEEKARFTPIELDNFKNETEDATLDFFIAKAERFFTRDSAEYIVKSRDGAYYYKDQYGREKKAPGKIYYGQYGDRRVKVVEDVPHRAARIQITSLKNEQGYMRDVKKYLNNIKNSHLYDKVEFDVGGITVSNRLVQDQPGRYVGTITYYQYFTGTRGDGGTYRDRTTRNVTYYVYVDVIDGMVVWNIKLGDIRATATDGGGRQ